MGRPAIDRDTPGDFNLLGGVQEDRLATMTAFARLLASPDAHDLARTDDGFFAKVIELSASDYGVRQRDIAEKMGVSQTAVSRWSTRSSLPPPYGRDAALKAIRELIEDHVERSKLAPLVSGTFVPPPTENVRRSGS